MPPKSAESLFGSRSAGLLEELVEDVVEILDLAAFSESESIESGNFCFVASVFTELSFESFLTIVDEEFTIFKFVDDGDDSAGLSENPSETLLLLKSRKS